MKLKPKRTFIWYLENGMFYLFLILLIFNLIVFGLFDMNFGINKTVGWQFDWSGAFNFYYYKYSALIYFIGFLLLLILKKRTNKILSLIYLGLLILVALITNNFGYNAYYIVKVFTFLVFLMIFFEAIFIKTKNE